MKKILIAIIFATAIFGTNAQQIVSNGSNWKYFDYNSDPGASWNQVSYNDASWASGNAQLGFGDGDESTRLTSGHITYYFRKTINVSDPTVRNGLKIGLLRDDGAVVYINGQEVARSNMPAGTITRTTYAAHTVAGADENMFFEYTIPSNILTAGNNLIAVEVHQRSSSSSDVSFDFKLDFVDYIVSVFRKNPYVLYPGSNTDMLLVWQLNQSGTCQLDWGTDTNYSSGTQSTNEYGSDHQHKYQIQGLTPGTKYYYRVTYNGSSFESDFIAGRNDSDTSFSFYAYGDTRSQPSEHNGVASRILAEIASDPTSQTFIVNSGDLVANGDDEGDWDNQFFSQQYADLNSLLSKLPYLSAVGNHEGNGLLFAKYFPYPMFVNSSDAYFSFDYANVHFIIIDQFADYSSGSTQYNWIVNDLQNANKPWIFALFHKPAWSAGGHSNSSDAQTILQPLFEQYGVSVVINGHNHYYSRAVVNNIHHITTGGGGAPLYSPNSSSANIVTTDESYHFLKITIADNNSLTIRAIRQNGTLIETVNITNVNAGINDIKYDSVTINSIDQKIVINSELDNIPMSIYDLSGRLIRQSILHCGINKIGIEANAIYIVRIDMPNHNQLVKKILIH